MKEYTRQKFFFHINCCRFLFFGHNLSLLKNRRFLPKILVCEEMCFVETRDKTLNLYLSVIPVSFEIQNPLFIEVRAVEHIFKK